MTTSHDGVSQSRTWFIFGGILSLIVGVFAISTPALFSLVITQLLGALCLVTGAIAIFAGALAAHLPTRQILRRTAAEILRM